MEYNSFYGGRRGASFIIVKSYKTVLAPEKDNIAFNKLIRKDLGLPEDSEISELNRNKWLSDNCMVYCFKQGGNYKLVNYDEYVIIDTNNKNDINNGKIYKRGYDYNNELGGAIYIGQIAGPAGMAPHSELKSYDKVQDMTTEDGLVIPSDGTTIEDESLNQYRKTKASLSVNGNKDLLPGKYYDQLGEEQFNDNIEYIACSIRDANSNESTVHIGFKIPYHVIEYSASSVSPYYHRSDAENKEDDNWDEQGSISNFINEKLVERIDDKTHPFFSQWKVNIPKGIKGDAANNFRVTTVIEEEGKLIELQDYDGIEDDRNITDNHKRQILVYDYYNYDINESGDPVSLYLGDYNMVDRFDIDDNGTITVYYTHKDEDVFEHKIKMIQSTSINTGSIEGEGNQKIHIAYNNGDEQDIGNPINYIMKTAISDAYHLLVLYSDPEKRQEIVRLGKNASYDGRNDWHDIGYIGQGNIGAIVGKSSDTNIQTIAETLPPYSAWFIVEEE